MRFLITSVALAATGWAAPADQPEGVTAVPPEQRLVEVNARIEMLDQKIVDQRAHAMGEHRRLLEARQEALEEDAEVRALNAAIGRKREELVDLRRQLAARLAQRSGVDDADAFHAERRRRFSEWSRERQRLANERRRLLRQLGRSEQAEWSGESPDSSIPVLNNTRGHGG